MVRDGVTVSVLRSREHEYNVSPSSRARLKSILPLAEDVGASLFVFPEQVRLLTQRAPDLGQAVARDDNLCPNCRTNIRQELLNHVYSEGGRDFETECPCCETMLEIGVEAVPSFTIAKIAVEHSVEPTAPRIKAGDDFGYMLSQQIKKD